MSRPRDHLIKDRIGELEDEIQRLANEFDEIIAEAKNEWEAFGHAEFYDGVQGQLTAAVGHLESAYSRMLNGADWLGVEPLDT